MPGDRNRSIADAFAGAADTPGERCPKLVSENQRVRDRGVDEFRTLAGMDELLGCARVSTDLQDPALQHDAWTTVTDDIALLSRAGHPGASPLAEGMEGRVYLLPDGTVGKVPHRAAPAEEDVFAVALASRDLPFGVPSPLGVVALDDGRTMKVERLLPGHPLDEHHDPEGDLEQRVVDAVVDVLDGLRSLSFEVPARTILDGERYQATTGTWADALLDLARRRFDRFGDQLEARDPAVRRTVDDLLGFLASRGPVAPRVIHGDICGANVLVDDSVRVTAVIDWGFLSVLAEPEFDAAIASAVLDMYGPRAAEADATLTDAVVARFGYERDVVLAYKGVYALLTSNVYSPEGADGHFAWCSAMLARDDVRAAAAAVASRASTRPEVG